MKTLEQLCTDAGSISMQIVDVCTTDAEIIALLAIVSETIWTSIADGQMQSIRKLEAKQPPEKKEG